MSQFIREKTFEAVSLLKRYINSPEIENEEAFVEIEQEIAILSYAIPDPIMGELKVFMEQLDHFIYSDEQPPSSLEDFFKFVRELNETLDGLVRKKIKPFIVGDISVFAD